MWMFIEYLLCTELHMHLIISEVERIILILLPTQQMKIPGFKEISDFPEFTSLLSGCAEI